MNHEIDIAIAIRSTGYTTFSQSGECAGAIIKQVPLVAAAPDLLESLKACVAMLELLDYSDHPATTYAQETIAKALGNAS